MRTVVYLDPHVVVCYSPETWLWKLHEYWQHYPRWSWRVSVTNRRDTEIQNKRVLYYGFKRHSSKRRNRYHLAVDANSFFRKQDQTVEDLLQLGLDIRTFCNAHGLEMRPSAAGIASQLLRHPMFYPFARRRVPGFINEEVRPYLPGGYYEAYADPAQRLTAALYVDQESAHHYAAASTPLPNANSVRAIGYTRDSERGYARAGGILFERELQKHGLIKAHVDVPWRKPDERHFLPPVMQRPGRRVAYLWTNELPHLASLGLTIRSLIAVWGTDEVDSGMAKYAEWARAVQQQYPALKALLLMPYGLLARHRSKVTYHHPGGKNTLILANQFLDDTSAREVVTQPDTANALQLGLIQAFVRALSLDMAQQLTAQGHEVVSIYADGVFVRLTKGKSIPLFAPWRVKEECLLELDESLRVPVRRTVRRDYLLMRTKEVTA